MIAWNHWFRSLLLGVVLLFLVPQACAQAPRSADWTPLFDGGSRAGWAHVGGGRFVLDEGRLRTVGGMGLLWYTERKIGDAVLRVEYMSPGDGNSGVFIRIPERPSGPWMPVNRGYEVQIDPAADATHRTGTLYSLTEARATVGTVPNTWHTMTIRLDGPWTVVYVNDTLVTEYTEGQPVPPKEAPYEPDRGRRPNAGYVGLQNHGVRDTVYFRRVAVRPLE